LVARQNIDAAGPTLEALVDAWTKKP